MRKFFFTILLLFMLSCNVFAANVIPDAVSLNNTNTLGVYQVGHSLVLYTDPDERSQVKQRIIWTKDDVVIPQNLKLTDLFVLYLENKDLALMAVTDETDEWVEVIYDNSTGQKGWIKKDDPYKFNTWMNFFSMYGRKYGLTILKGSPESVNNMYGSTDDNAKVISTINKQPDMINLNVIRGNWMLVTVVDVDRTPKTGYIRWRSDDGVKYLFPKFN